MVGVDKGTAVGVSIRVGAMVGSVVGASVSLGNGGTNTVSMRCMMP